MMYCKFCMLGFLLPQALFKKATELGFRALLQLHLRIPSILRSCCAIALLPKELMIFALLSLALEAQQEGILHLMQPIFTYLRDVWFTGWRLHKVSVFLSAHRTNNVAESVNKMLQKRTGIHHPSLWTFIGMYDQPCREGTHDCANIYPFHWLLIPISVAPYRSCAQNGV